MENFTKFYDQYDLTFRYSQPQDLEAIETLAKSEHFDVGMHNLKLYYETSPQMWRLVVDKENRAIVTDGINVLSNGLLYAYITIVHQDYRGQGLTRPLAPGFPTNAVMASSTDNSIVRYGMNGLHWLEKRHGFYGFCRKRLIQQLVPPHVAGVSFLPATDDRTLKALLDYDNKLCMVEREKFVSEWCMPENKEYGSSIVALKECDGTCVGYGTLRLFSDYYGVQPLYADSDEIAEAIMTILLQNCLSADAYVYMPLMAAKRKAMELCYRLGMTITGTEMRNCSQLAIEYAKKLPMEKVYAVHEYYPV